MFVVIVEVSTNPDTINTATAIVGTFPNKVEAENWERQLKVKITNPHTRIEVVELHDPTTFLAAI
jgi:Mlc titration factor MtfA (ptsG expression regulator)